MKYILVLALLIFLISFQSCIKAGGKCEEPLFITNSGLTIDFKDSSGKYLYSGINPTYNKDSLKVWEEATNNYLSVLSTQGNIPNSYSGYWRMDFGPLYNSQTDAVSYDREICKKFILEYRVGERDTITSCYKSKKTECGSVFETLKVYYKGGLIGERTNDVGMNLTITKK
jgi:hypothetical protein